MTVTPSVSRIETTPEDLDLGFDTLITRYGTHRLLDPAALERARPDVSRLIAPLEVTFAAYLADGTVVLCCPDGVPDSFADIVEPLAPSLRPPVKASLAPAPDSLPSALVERLDALSAKLDHIQRDQALGATVATRLEDVRTTLLDGLSRAVPRETPSPVALQKWDTDQLIEDMSARMRQMLHETELRMLSHVHETAQEAAPQIETIEQGLNQLIASGLDQAALWTQLARIEGNIDGLIKRPTPLAELAVQRKGIAHFLESMTTVMRRLDSAIDRLEAPAEPAALSVPDELIAALAGIEGKLDRVEDAAPDLSRLYQMLDILRDDIRQAALSVQPQENVLHDLVARIAQLAERPDPAADLTVTRESLAALSDMVDQGLRQIDTTLASLAQSTETEALAVETRALHEDLRAALAKAAVTSDEIGTLQQAVGDLAAQITSKTALTEQRKDFARFGTALSQALRQLEDRSEKQDAVAKDLQTMAAEAILGMMVSQSLTIDQTAGTDPMTTARLRLAEAMATDFKNRGWSPTKRS